MNRIVPVNDWILVYPLIQDERKSDGGIIIPEGIVDEIDVSYVKVIETPKDVDVILDGEHIEKDAILLIPRMEGLTLKLDNKTHKLVKMDRVIAIEEKNE